MVDILYNNNYSLQKEIIESMGKQGIKINNLSKTSDFFKISYEIDKKEKEIILVGGDINKPIKALDEIIKNGLYAVMLKGLGGFNVESIQNVLPKFQNKIHKGGFYLGIKEPLKTEGYNKLASGILSYSNTKGDEFKGATHSLFQKIIP